MNKYTTKEILDQIQAYHLKRVVGLKTAHSLSKNIQTSELPCCILIAQQGTHDYESHQSSRTIREIQAQVYVCPDGQNRLGDIALQTYNLIDAFKDAYMSAQQIAPSLWLQFPIVDSGIILLEWGETYYGFTIDFSVYSGDQNVHYNGGVS